MPRERLDKLLRIPILNRSGQAAHSEATWPRFRAARGLRSGAAPAGNPAVVPQARAQPVRRLRHDGDPDHAPPAPGSMRPGYVGAPIPGVEAKLGENDELLIRSPMNMLGYFATRRRHAPCFTEDGFIRTGDVCADRSGRPAQDHRPGEGAVQDQQRQVRGARADREPVHGASHGGGLLPDGDGNAQPVRGRAAFRRIAAARRRPGTPGAGGASLLELMNDDQSRIGSA